MLINLNETIKWPTIRTMTAIENLRHEFNQHMLKAYANIFNIHCVNEAWLNFFKDYIDYVIKFDIEGEITNIIVQD